MHNDTFADGRYKVLKKLGAGGMGTVFKAQDTRVNQTVALKVVRSQELDAESLARFKREGQTMNMLSHPNIVSVLDTGQEQDTHFIVMELVTGRSLQDFMDSRSDRRIDMPAALSITKQVSQALKHTHTQGILHRDIKPANIMIDNDGQAKLADFGIAKGQGLSTLTQTGDVVGTAAYMAPEQALGEVVDARTDLYALGCVLFEMVAGQRPFSADNAARLLFSHVNDIPSLPRRVAVEIAPALEALIFKLLAKDPGQRFQSADELLLAIDHVEAQTEPQVVALQTAERLWAQVIVGRDEELALLRQRLESILQGEGSLVFITGEAGIGKSRLAHQLEVYAGMKNIRFFAGRARHLKERVPYQPWIDILQSALRRTSPMALAKLLDDSAAFLVKLVPELAEKLDELPEAPTAPPAQQREQLLAAVTRFLVNLSENAPLVLFLDDLQWADRASLHLLSHVAQRMAAARILLVGAYREDELDGESSLAQIAAELNRERIPEALPLTRLNAEQTVEKIRKTFGRQELPELEAFVFEKTEGNPFFIEELLRALLAAEHIVLVEGTWQVKDLSHVQVPSGIQTVVEERLARLSDEGREVLSMAAVIGREFNFQTLQTVVDLDEDSLVALIDEALQAQLLVGRRVPGEEVYAFADAPVRDVLYEAISIVRRNRHHLRVGEAIERVYAENLGECAVALAHHFSEGNDATRAVHYSVMAGDKANEVYAWQAAHDHYEVALKLFDGSSLQQRADVLHKMATLTYPMGAPEAGLSYSKQALEIYTELGDKPNMVAMHLFIQTLYTGGEFDGAKEYLAVDHLREVASLLEDDVDTVEKGLVHQRTAHLHLHFGQAARAVEQSQKAVDIFNALEVPMGTSLGTGLAYTGQIDEGIAYSEGNWEGVRKLGNPLIMAIFGHELSLNLALARDVPRAREWGERVLPELIKAGPVLEGWLRRPLALIYTLSGELSKAEETVKEEEHIEAQTLLGCYYEDAAGIGLHYLRRGDPGAARKYIATAIPEHTERRNLSAVAGCLYLSGILNLVDQNYQEAEESLLRSLHICHDGGNVLFELWVLPLLGELYLKMGQSDQAMEYVERGFELLQPDRNWCGLPAPLHTVQGMLASTQRKWVEAEGSFDEAVAINRQYELPWDEAKALYEWGLMYGQRKKKEAAYEKLDEAMALFKKVGAEKDVENTQAAKERVGASWFSRIRGSSR